MGKKVLFITNHDLGIYQFRKELIQTLILEGNDVFISTPLGTKTDALNDMGAMIIPSQLSRHSMNPFKDLKLLIQYYKLLNIVKPDVVLTYTIKPNIYGSLAARIKRIKTIATITGLGQALNKGMISLIPETLYRLSLKKAFHVFFQNESNMKYMVSKKIIRKNYSVIQGSGINLEEFAYSPYPSDGVIHYLFAGRVMKDKGIEEFLKAAQNAKSTYPKCQFDIVGPMEENYTQLLKEYENNGIIHYHEYVENLANFYKKAHVIVLPSYHEGLSNVLLEASSVGRPSITSNIPGCKEVIMDNENGYLVAPKDETDLTSKLISFYKLDYNEKKNMGLKAREIVENKFDRTSIVKTYIERIKNV